MNTNSPPRTVNKIGVIVPTASTSKTDQRDIDRNITQMIATAAKTGQRHGVEISLHVTGNRTGNHTIRNTAKAYNNVTVRTHTPHFKRNASKRAQVNEVHRANGRLAATVDNLIVITGNKPSLTNMDQSIINSVAKREKKIVTRKITPTPTQPDLIPEKARPPLKESAYRVNLRDFKDLDHLLEDYCTHGLDDGQKPIYTGAPNAKTGNTGSPLANQFRGSANWQTLYKQWLWAEMQAGNAEILSALREIDRTTPLICYCHNRKPCHTDIIRKAALWLAEEDRQARKDFDRILDGTYPDTEPPAQDHQLYELDQQHRDIAEDLREERRELLEATI